MCFFLLVSTPVLLGADSKQPLGADSYSLFLGLFLILLLCICEIEIVWLSYISFGIRADFRSIQHNRRQPLESKAIKRASQPNMTVPFKFLPHEILKSPNQSLQSVYTPFGHMSSSSPSQQRS